MKKLILLLLIPISAYSQELAPQAPIELKDLELSFDHTPKVESSELKIEDNNLSLEPNPSLTPPPGDVNPLPEDNEKPSSPSLNLLDESSSNVDQQWEKYLTERYLD